VYRCHSKVHNCCRPYNNCDRYQHHFSTFKFILSPCYAFDSFLRITFFQTTPTATAQVSTTRTIDETTTSEATIVSYASTTTTDVIASTVTCSAVPTSFWLVAQGAGVDGQFVVTTQQHNEIIDTFSTNIGEATQFVIRDGNLYQGTYEANTDNTDIGTIFFDTPGSFVNVIYMTCSTISPFAGALSCSGYNGNSIFQLCPDGIYCQGGIEPCGGVSLGNAVDPRCQAIQFTAVPACNPVTGG
jgi:hypothetical protein